MKCALDDCRCEARPCHRVCTNHWRQIPTELRAVLVAAFKNRHADHDTHLRARKAEVELARHYRRRPKQAA